MYHINARLSSLLFSFLIVSISYGKNTLPDSLVQTFFSIKTVSTSEGCIIRIAGRLIEKNSQKPIKSAGILVRCGTQVLASKQTAKDGTFIFQIPPEQVSQKLFSLKITFKDHIFTRENIKPVSQDIFIEINGSLLLEEEPIEDYKLPIHSLSSPNVGRVLISEKGVKAKQESPKRLPQI